MGWEREYEHWRDMGHTWGPGIDDYVEPTEKEELESSAKFAAYEKELSVLRVSAREKYVNAGAELKAGLPSGHDITFGKAPYHWREDYSTAEIELCKEAAEEMGFEFGRQKWPIEQKDEFMVIVERYGFLPGEGGGNIHRYAATGIEDPMKCLQLVADFKAIGCNPTTYWLAKKEKRMDIFYSISESDTGRLYKEMERWGVPFNKKEALNKEIKQLAAEIEQFAYDFDTYNYKDTVADREQALVELEQNIKNGNVSCIKDWHNDITLDEHGWDFALESKTLLNWLDKVEKKIQKEIEKSSKDIIKESDILEEGMRVKVEGDSAELWIEDYNVRVCTFGTVELTPGKNDKKVLVTLDEIDNDRNVCVAMRRSKVKAIEQEKKLSVDEKIADVKKDLSRKENNNSKNNVLTQDDIDLPF